MCISAFSQRVLLLATAFFLSAIPALAQPANRPPSSASELDGEIESVTIHPVFDDPFVTAEHPMGSEDQLGNRLGRDFIVMKFRTRDVPFPHVYENDGKQNEDWYGWREEVLAPVDAIVTDVDADASTHAPGQLDRDQAANSITFTRDDGLKIVYAHVREVRVAEGDSVSVGEVVARVGNNGPSFMPHVHVGAWKKDRPLQIRVNLAAMGRLRSYGPEQ